MPSTASYALAMESQPALRLAPVGPDSVGATRERLVAAASELLQQGGPEAVTLRAVGERVGVSRAAPYRHFRDKDDLLVAVAIDGFGLFEQDMRRAMLAPCGPDGYAAPELASVHRGCVAYVDSALARPRLYRLMFGDRLAGVDDPRFEQAASSGMALLFDGIAASQRAGAIRVAGLFEVAVMIWALLHGLVDLGLNGHLGGQRVADVRRMAPAMISDLLAGLAP